MTVRRWQLQEAKQQFSQVVERALSGEPQLVMRNGEEVAVVIDVNEYRRLTSNRHDFKKFLLEGPPFFDDLVIERSTDLPREIEL